MTPSTQADTSCCVRRIASAVSSKFSKEQCTWSETRARRHGLDVRTETCKQYSFCMRQCRHVRLHAKKRRRERDEQKISRLQPDKIIRQTVTSMVPVILNGNSRCKSLHHSIKQQKAIACSSWFQRRRASSAMLSRSSIHDTLCCFPAHRKIIDKKGT